MNRIDFPFEAKFAPDAADGSFEGYASTFGNVDLGGDVIERGAFKDTLKEWARRKSLPPMLLGHRADDLPIGVLTAMAEDERGLKVAGELVIETERGRDVHATMRRGALKGLSIGYITIEAVPGKAPHEGRRVLKKIDLMEISLVAIPANPSAMVTGVKAIEQWTEREFEHVLRDAGVPRAFARAVILHGFKTARSDLWDADGGLGPTVASLVRVAGTMNPTRS